MDRVLTRFVSMLKQNGMAVSPAETIDALCGLAYTGLDERETVRTVLCSTLIKDTQDIPLFDALFDRFFSLPKRSSAADPALTTETEPEALILERGGADAVPNNDSPDSAAAVDILFDPEKIGEMFNPAHDPDAINFATLAQHLVLSRSRSLIDQARKRTYQLNSRAAPAGVRPGELSLDQAIAEIEPGLLAAALTELLDDLRELELDPDLLDQLSRQMDGVIARLPELLQSYIQRDLALQPEAVETGTSPDYQFSAEEQHTMAEIIRRLGRQMRGALSHRRRTDHSGRINVAHTIRNSLKYDGIPFDPVLASRRDERPRLVVICDISLSVRNTARFTLHLLYSLQALFERVRSFVFVDDLAEVSTHFERLPLDDAIGLVFSGGVIDPDANSNYGRALEQFYEQHRSAVTPRTTVMILGDGRGNRNPPNAWVLEALRRRAKQLIWLTPETRGTWQLAGSDMPIYAPICHRVEVVRNLEQLGEVAQDLVRRISTQ